MASTFQALTREIEALKKKAESARKQEAAELVALIKSGIELYGLTAQDLGLAAGAEPAKKAKEAKKAATPSKVKSAAPASAAPAAKYTDGAGHSWSGRGPRPGWVKAAIDGGQTLDDLLAKAQPKSAPAKAAKPAAKKAAKSAKKASVKSSKAKAVETPAQPSAPASTAKYKDDAGNSWTGRGPKPGWLRTPSKLASRSKTSWPDLALVRRGAVRRDVPSRLRCGAARDLVTSIPLPPARPCACSNTRTSTCGA
jgi:DNA-binding protein H-NS